MLQGYGPNLRQYLVLLNILRINKQIKTKFCIHIIIDNIYVGIIKQSFSASLQQGYDSWLASEFGFCSNEKTYWDKILYTQYHWQVLCLDCNTSLFINLQQRYSLWFTSEFSFSSMSWYLPCSSTARVTVEAFQGQILTSQKLWHWRTWFLHLVLFSSPRCHIDLSGVSGLGNVYRMAMRANCVCVIFMLFSCDPYVYIHTFFLHKITLTEFVLLFLFLVIAPT